MDLWIRSQNKRELRPNPKLGIEEIKDEFYILDRFNFEDGTILGIYKTEQRALEVLDEIQSFLENSYEMYIQQRDNGLVFVVPIYHSKKTVFEMPKV